MRRQIRQLHVFMIFAVLVFACMAHGCGSRQEEDGFKEIQEELGESGEEPPEKESEEASSGKEDTESSSVYVHVCGQVKNPGVYELAKESRIYEAIEAAGGTTEYAAPENLNQAQILADGQQIYVPSEEEAKNAVPESNAFSGDITGNSDDGKISLNNASKEELMTLSGVGEVKAESIIRYRQEHGGFQSIEELKEVEGIKDGIFNRVKDLIKI